MLDWLQTNKEWFLSGIGVVILSGFVAFFKKIFSKTPTPGQIIIRVDKSNFVSGSDLPLVGGAAPIARIARITPDDIQAAVDKAPLLQRDSVGKQYEGIRIEWKTTLLGATPDNEQVRLHLQSMEQKSIRSPSIWCVVKLADYRELAILQSGAKISVNGVIENVDRMGIDIKDATLAFLDIQPSD